MLIPLPMDCELYLWGKLGKSFTLLEILLDIYILYVLKVYHQWQVSSTVMGYLLGGTKFEGQFHTHSLHQLSTPHSL